MSTQTPRIPMLSLRLKILIPLLALMTINISAGYYGLHNYLKTSVKGIMEEEIKAIMATATNCLNEDVLETITTGDIKYDKSAGWPKGMTDQRYWDQQDCLAKIDLYNPRAELFTYYFVNENTLAYGLDQFSTLVPESSYPFGKEFTAKDDEDFNDYLLGLQGLHFYDDLKYVKEENVYYLGATSPLKNSAGRVIGGLTIYLDASVMTDKLNKLSNFLYIIFAVIYLVITGTILVITRNATTQLSALKNASTRVAGGDYTPITLKPQAFGDEVSTLTELFNTMLEKVRGREETLKHQVEDLKIIIDFEKRDKDVQEIKESEFFKDLKARAAEIRKHKEAQDKKEE